MALLQFIFLLLILPVSSVVPGFLLIRRLRWSATETVAASVAISLILLYLIAFLIYVAAIPWSTAWMISAGYLIAAALSWRDIRRFFSRHSVRRQVRAFGMLWLLGMLMLGVIVHYSGGHWAGDYTEHYQRVAFFLNRLPPETRFIDVYTLSSRPPMMHLLGALHLAQVGQGFDRFQIVSLFLNLLVLFPCVLLAGQFMLQGPRRVGLIAAMLALMPAFAHNAVWAWNKQFTAFFVLLSIGLYLRGLRARSASRLIVAAACMAAGILVHYSAIPYALFLLLHYLWNLRRHSRPGFEIVGSAVVALMLLASWLGWSIATYGLKQTFGSNTTAIEFADRSSSQKLAVVGRNSVDTLVPHPLRMSIDQFTIDFVQPNRFGFWRDYFFTLYQTSLPPALGLLGWAAVICIAFRLMQRADRRDALFWLQLLGFTLPVGMAVVGSREPYGVAHICLLPILLMARTLLATGLMLFRPWLRAVLLISIALDVVLGIVLQLRMEMLGPEMFFRQGAPIVPLSWGLLNPQAVLNSASRFNAGFTYISDHLPAHTAMLGLVIALLAFMLYRIDKRASIAAVAVLIAGSIVSLADRRAGYDISQTLRSPAVPTTQEYEKAIAPFLPDVHAHSEDPLVHFNLAAACYEFGQLDSALQAARNTLLLDPNHVRARHLVGLLRVINAIRLSPDDPLIPILVRDHEATEANHVRYGAVLFHQGFRQRGLAVLEDAANTYPTSVATHANYGLALVATGRLDQGIAQYEAALRLAPRSAEIITRLREALSARGDDPQAIEQHINQIRTAP